MPIAESDFLLNLNHMVNNPLAAIRNALYLAACRTNDPELLSYLEIANQEVTVISDVLRRARPEPLHLPGAEESAGL